MNDPRVFWLTVTNIALGAAVVLVILGIATGVLCEFVAKLKARHREHQIDRELQGLFHPSGTTHRPHH